MRTTVLSLLVALVLVGAAAPALAKGPGERAQAAREMDERDFNNLTAAAREQGLARAESAKLFARWSYGAGNATGRFVGFTLAESTGAITGFALRGNNTTTPVFASVTPTPFAGNGSAKATGSVLHLAGGDASLAAHNNPLGLLRYSAGNATLGVSYVLADGANATLNGTQALVSLGSLHGHVVVQGNGTLELSADNRTLVASVPAGGAVVFMGHPGDAPSATSALHDVKDAIASGQLGAITTVVDAGGAPLEERASFGVTARASSVGKGRANITVSSDDPTGKAVVVNLDGSIIPPGDVGKVNVTVDGVRAARASSLGAVLRGSNATNATVFVNRTDTGVQIVIYLPHFSDREVSITTASATTTAPTVATTSPTSVVTPTTSPSSPTTASPTTTATPSATPTAEGGNDTPGFGVLAALLGVAIALLAARRR